MQGLPPIDRKFDNRDVDGAKQSENSNDARRLELIVKGPPQREQTKINK